MELNILENICYHKDKKMEEENDDNQEENQIENNIKLFSPHKPSFPSYNNDLGHYVTNIYTKNSPQINR